MKYEEVAIVMRKHKNVYAEISTNFSKNPALGATPLKRLIETLQVWVGGDYDRVILAVIIHLQSGIYARNGSNSRGN